MRRRPRVIEKSLDIATKKFVDIKYRISLEEIWTGIPPKVHRYVKI